MTQEVGSGLLDLLWNSAEKISIVALLIGIVIGLVTGKWIAPMYALRKSEEREERFMRIAERALGVTDRGVKATERIADIVVKQNEP